MGGAPDVRSGFATLPSALPAAGVEEAVDMALDMALRGRLLATVAVPTDPAYSLIAQAASAFEGVHPLGNGELRVNCATFGVRPAAAASVDAPSLAPLHHTLQRLSEVRSASLTEGLRVELSGPVTLALALVAAGVDQARAIDAARMATVYRCEALVAAVRRVEPELRIAVVMDERSMVGSMHPTFPLTVRQVRSLLDPVVDAIDAAAGGSPVLIGAHVPGRADWRTIISSGVSLVSMPPDASLVGWASWVQALLDNGGYIAWGAVPVDRPLGTNEELLWRHLLATWRDLEAAGVDPSMLRERALVTTSDGLGSFDAAQLPHILELLDALAGRILLQVDAARATAGI